MCANSMCPPPPPRERPESPPPSGVREVRVSQSQGSGTWLGGRRTREGAGLANDSAGPWTRRQGFALGLPTAHTGVGVAQCTHHTHTHSGSAVKLHLSGLCVCLRNGPSLCLSHHLYCPNTEEAYPGQRNAVAYCHAVHA